MHCVYFPRGLCYASLPFSSHSKQLFSKRFFCLYPFATRQALLYKIINLQFRKKAAKLLTRQTRIRLVKTTLLYTILQPLWTWCVIQLYTCNKIWIAVVCFAYCKITSRINKCKIYQAFDFIRTHVLTKEPFRCSNTGPQNMESSCRCWRSSGEQRMVVDTEG